MPQMAPMWWLTLMIMFLTLLFMMMSMLYFNTFIKSPESLKTTKKFMAWMW